MIANERAARRRGGRGRRQSQGSEIDNDSTRRQRRIYVTAPVTQRDNPELHQRRLDQVQSRYPTAEVIDALGEYDGARDWVKRWPLIARTIDVLVFSTDADGVIGTGTVKEIMDAIVQRVDVELVTDDGFAPLSEVMFAPLEDANARRAVRVIHDDA